MRFSKSSMKMQDSNTRRNTNFMDMIQRVPTWAGLREKEKKKMLARTRN